MSDNTHSQPTNNQELIALPLDEWHEDDGAVLWWKFPVSEPPYVGTPLDDDFPDYVTHWTRIRVPNRPVTAEPRPENFGKATVPETTLPEALRGCTDFALGFVEGARSASATTPELDRAIVCRALIALQAWDEWVYDRAPLDAAFESLRAVLDLAGYLDTTGGSNG